MPPSEHKPRKETSKIRTTLFWRHKRMKKQRLAVLRWRRLMIIRSHNIEKAKKRELRDQKEYSEIKKKAEDFDAEKYLQELLEDARRGGYKIDLFKRWHT
ncbi:hypothetical protein FSP39_008226 [Pinctada imbricata]|uniref:Uncharacterized protein n=1 Tax=Pinctada imbricata TaxID=66713 RepID=A0AA88YH14_PINIB|nr:hypothetical protein FSP39_008226 [Pinctada imbricata]